MTRYVGMLAFILFSLLGAGRPAKGQDINFCALPLSPAILQAHTSFNAVYEFDVDQHGVPLNIKSVSKQFTKLEEVVACLAQWKLQNAASKHLVVVFTWQHGIGWTKLAISGSEVNITVRLSGQRCPYCSMAADEKKPSGPTQN
jgi:hypothetical protein